MAAITGHRSRSGRLVIFVAIALAISYFTFITSYPSRQKDGTRRRPFTYVHSTFDWAHRPEKHPVASYERLPSGSPLQLRRIQYDFQDQHDTRHWKAQERRRKVVKQTFQKSWESYREYSWGYDELSPVSLGGVDTFSGWGATLVDSLDVLWIMDMKDEFDEAAHAVATIDWDNSTALECSLFETNIRYLGGLLAAYDLSNETMLLNKAVELGHMLYAAFDTPTRMPINAFNFEKAKKGELVASPREVSASIGSLSLEFTRLSQLTGDLKFFDAINKIKKELARTQDLTKLPGLWPTWIDAANGFLTPDSSFTIGAMADSLYEYLPKMYALLGGLDDVYKKMFKKAMETTKNNLLFRPMLPDEEKEDILFAGTMYSNGVTTADRIPEGQHLACFAGGMYALGGRLFDINEYVEIGEQLTKGCAWAYKSMPVGIMPEQFRMLACKTPNLERCPWDEARWKKEGSKRLPKGYAIAHDTRYLLRPEAIESVFLLYRMTGKREYQDIAWEMFEAIKKATETRFAYSAINDVTRGGVIQKTDSMESFWLAETLKYFYLIFSPPDLISLDNYVLNTEAHPLKLPKPSGNNI